MADATYPSDVGQSVPEQSRLLDEQPPPSTGSGMLAGYIRALVAVVGVLSVLGAAGWALQPGLTVIDNETVQSKFWEPSGCVDKSGKGHCQAMLKEGGCQSDHAGSRTFCKKTCNKCEEAKGRRNEKADSEVVACCADESSFSPASGSCKLNGDKSGSVGDCPGGWCYACYVPGGVCSQGTKAHCWTRK